MNNPDYGLIFSEMEDLDDSNRYFNSAFSKLEGILNNSELKEYFHKNFEGMPYFIYSDYARLVYYMGHLEEGIEMLLDIARKMDSKGIAPDYPMKVLREIDKVPNGLFSQSELK